MINIRRTCFWEYQSALVQSFVEMRFFTISANHLIYGNKLFFKESDPKTWGIFFVLERIDSRLFLIFLNYKMWHTKFHKTVNKYKFLLWIYIKMRKVKKEKIPCINFTVNLNFFQEFIAILYVIFLTYISLPKSKNQFFTYLELEIFRKKPCKTLHITFFPVYNILMK